MRRLLGARLATGRSATDVCRIDAADVEVVALTFPYSPPRNRAHAVAPRDSSYAVSHGLLSGVDARRYGTGTITFYIADGDLGNYGGNSDVTFGETNANGAFRVSGVS